MFNFVKTLFMKRILFLLCLFSSFGVFAQINQQQNIKVSGKYLGTNVGLASGVVRDVLTSPLFYSAVMPALTIDYKHYSEKSIFDFSFMTLNGIYITATHDNFVLGTGNSFDFDFSYYRLLEATSDEELKYYLGAGIGNFSDIRVNNSFMNAAFAFDNFTDFGLNLRADWRIDSPEKQKKFLWLIKYTKKEKHYLLSGKIGLPIASVIYRPGFTNPGNSTLYDEALFEGYKSKVKVFSGLNTDISISRILTNGNMIRFGYYWDFITSGKSAINRIDMSHHVFTFGLIFKIK